VTLGCGSFKIKGKGIEFRINPINYKKKLFQIKISRRANSTKELF